MYACQHTRMHTDTYQCARRNTIDCQECFHRNSSSHYCSLHHFHLQQQAVTDSQSISKAVCTEFTQNQAWIAFFDHLVAVMQDLHAVASSNCYAMPRICVSNYPKSGSEGSSGTVRWPSKLSTMGDPAGFKKFSNFGMHTALVDVRLYVLKFDVTTEPREGGGNEEIRNALQLQLMSIFPYGTRIRQPAVRQ